MRHRFLTVFGYGLVGLIVVVLCLEVALAVRAGHAFYGVNHKGQPLGVAYPIAALIIVVGAGLYVWLGRAYSAFKQRGRK